MSRLPLRVRLVAGFSATMLVVLAGAAAFVYWRVQFALDRDLDAELEQASQALAPLVEPDGSVANQRAAEAAGVAWQVVGPDGTVMANGGPAGTTDLVGRAVLAGATKAVTVNTGRFIPAGDIAYRLRVEPLAGSDDLLVVGVRRDHRDEALRELLVQLAIAGTAALVLTAFVGYRLARGALAPVERYRQRAEEISQGAAGLRLDVPPDRDDEVTRLGNTLNRMLGELEGSIERERRFVDEASHELRTPLTLLSSRIQITRRRSRTVAEHEAVLDELAIDVARLADLAEQLLSLGEASATDGAEKSTDVGSALTRASGARTTGAVVVEAPRRAPPPAAIDVGSLDRIVTNVIDNALTHGRPPVRLRTRSAGSAATSWVVLEVRDDGDGMEPGLLATAAGRFTRAPEARRRPGAGLGLSLVEGLVARAGGELRLCHGGTHQHAGGVVSGVPCVHDASMTVTVILPSARSS